MINPNKINIPAIHLLISIHECTIIIIREVSLAYKPGGYTSGL
jgi:hypothetical protein